MGTQLWQLIRECPHSEAILLGDPQVEHRHAIVRVDESFADDHGV
jgi:hypothetical protein